MTRGEGVSVPERRAASLMAGMALAILLVVPMPFREPGRLVQAWWDFLHVPVFAALVLLGTGIAPLRRWPAVALVALAVPVVEGLQSLTGREASWSDVAYGYAGWLVGGLLMGGRRSGAGIAAAVLALTTVYPVAVTFDHLRMRLAFPELAGADGWLARSRWTVTGCTMEPVAEGWRITAQPGHAYPGVFLGDMVRDWTGADRLCLDVEALGGEEIGMWIRVDDRYDSPPYHDRFQYRAALEPGLNRICLDAATFGRAENGRLMERDRIAAFGLFFDASVAGRTVLVHRIALDYPVDE